MSSCLSSSSTCGIAITLLMHGVHIAVPRIGVVSGVQTQSAASAQSMHSSYEAPVANGLVGVGGSRSELRHLVTLLLEQGRYRWGTAGCLLPPAAGPAMWHDDRRLRVPTSGPATGVDRREGLDARRLRHGGRGASRRLVGSTPHLGQNSIEQVGSVIAEANALHFAVPRDRVLDASILGARAGTIRDESGEQTAAGTDVTSSVVSRSACGGAN